MSQQEGPSFFDRTVADKYDRQSAWLAPLADALHALIGAAFSDLPVDASVLCVGAGTGSELLYLARRFPRWSFTAVEPSAPMLEVCRRRATEAGIAARCVFHEGYLDSLPSAKPFDAATALLVSQFILSPEARTRFFSDIAARLRPGGCLVSADLASDVASEGYQRLLGLWLRLRKTGDVTDERLQQLRAAYGTTVAVLPVGQVRAFIVAGGFEEPDLFFQAGLIHAWHALKPAGFEAAGARRLG